MNERTLKRKLKKQRRLCAVIIAGIGVFSFLIAAEIAPTLRPIPHTYYRTASQAVGGVSVVAIDSTTIEGPVDMASGPGVVSAPEPASLMLMVPALLLLGRRRRG